MNKGRFCGPFYCLKFVAAKIRIPSRIVMSLSKTNRSVTELIMIDPIVLAERGLVPDVLLRRGIRRELADRLVQEGSGDLNSK